MRARSRWTGGSCARLLVAAVLALLVGACRSQSARLSLLEPANFAVLVHGEPVDLVWSAESLGPRNVTISTIAAETSNQTDHFTVPQDPARTTYTPSTDLAPGRYALQVFTAVGSSNIGDWSLVAIKPPSPGGAAAIFTPFNGAVLVYNQSLQVTVGFSSRVTYGTHFNMTLTGDGVSLRMFSFRKLLAGTWNGTWTVPDWLPLGRYTVNLASASGNHTLQDSVRVLVYYNFPNAPENAPKDPLGVAALGTETPRGEDNLSFFRIASTWPQLSVMPVRWKWLGVPNVAISVRLRSDCVQISQWDAYRYACAGTTYLAAYPGTFSGMLFWLVPRIRGVMFLEIFATRGGLTRTDSLQGAIWTPSFTVTSVVPRTSLVARMKLPALSYDSWAVDDEKPNAYRLALSSALNVSAERLSILSATAGSVYVETEFAAAGSGPSVSDVRGALQTKGPFDLGSGLGTVALDALLQNPSAQAGEPGFIGSEGGGPTDGGGDGGGGSLTPTFSPRPVYNDNNNSTTWGPTFLSIMVVVAILGIFICAVATRLALYVWCLRRRRSGFSMEPTGTDVVVTEDGQQYEVQWVGGRPTARRRLPGGPPGPPPSKFMNARGGINGYARALVESRTFGEADIATRADQERCAVCLTEYEAGEQMRILPCMHGYHKACIDTWLHQKTTCPMCHFDLNKHFLEQEAAGNLVFNPPPPRARHRRPRGSPLGPDGAPLGSEEGQPSDGEPGAPGPVPQAVALWDAGPGPGPSRPPHAPLRLPPRRAPRPPRPPRRGGGRRRRGARDAARAAAVRGAAPPPQSLSAALAAQAGPAGGEFRTLENVRLDMGHPTASGFAPLESEPPLPPTGAVPPAPAATWQPLPPLASFAPAAGPSGSRYGEDESDAPAPPAASGYANFPAPAAPAASGYANFPAPAAPAASGYANFPAPAAPAASGYANLPAPAAAAAAAPGRSVGGYLVAGGREPPALASDLGAESGDESERGGATAPAPSGPQPVRNGYIVS
eukprot:tig00020684_g12854.t1